MSTQMTAAQFQALQQKVHQAMPSPKQPTYETSVPVDNLSDDFLIRLNDIVDVLDATPPSQAQWDKLREKIQEQVGVIVSARIRKAAEPYPKAVDPAIYSTMKAQQAHIASQYQNQIDAYKARMAAEAQAATNFSASVSDQFVTEGVSWTGETEDDKT